MKKILSILLIVVFLVALSVSVMAAPEAPQITLQPQNYHYPQYSVAVYTVKATGTNLHATWYLQFEGKTYNLSDNTNGIEPWEGYAGESYGPIQQENEFSWFFGGIDSGLNGAEIWCVLEDGHYDVTSAKAVVTVQGNTMPPEILQFPASVAASRGQETEIRVVAKSVDGSQLNYQWYETTTGKLWDIRAMDGEDSDFLVCDTNTVGTRYYVCCVTSTNGGMAYSSVVPVTVTDSAPETAGEPPSFLTKTLPQGTVGEDYGFTLETDDHGAVFSIAYNPGGANDFDKTGLSLSQEGILMGKLTKAGTYTFMVCVGNDYGEDYGVLTLTVTEPATTPSDVPENTEDTTPTAETPTEEPTQTTPTEDVEVIAPSVPKGDGDEKDGVAWWAIVAVAVAAAATGTGVAIVILRRKK